MLVDLRSASVICAVIQERQPDFQGGERSRWTGTRAPGPARGGIESPRDGPMGEDFPVSSLSIKALNYRR